MPGLHARDLQHDYRSCSHMPSVCSGFMVPWCIFILYTVRSWYICTCSGVFKPDMPLVPAGDVSEQFRAVYLSKV